ncbi:MAG: A/G-specific adenine glycosylase [Oscillospiraceae bacterium]|nr:A/G-specific adenine glycosylase [Oscillospiraceae bacterium]
MKEEARLFAGVVPLLDWYRENARSLPWRSEPTPYRVWVSEIMLQQTRVAAVLDYFRRFMEALPDVAALANCPEEQLLKLWQGLGYYSRARNLQKAARMICNDLGGEFPCTWEGLRKLPGVGDYTAGAIASIAFGLPEPAVDGNVLRVVTRLLADESDITIPATKGRIRALLAEVMPLEEPGTFNQALMELGALVCLPNGEPQCQSCPWEGLCLARARELTDVIPVKPPKKARRVEQRTVFLIFHEGRVALRRRPARGLLASLWELPNELGDTLPLDQWGITPQTLEDGGKGTHIFTHIEWHMTGVVVRAVTDALPEDWVWATDRELAERYPIPSAFDSFRERVETEMNKGETV